MRGDAGRAGSCRSVPWRQHRRPLRQGIGTPGPRVTGMTPPFLHRHFPQLGTTIGHVSLGTRPTPVRRLERLGLNTEVWLKDESFFGDGGWGGNPPLAALAGGAPGCANSSGLSPKRTVAAGRRYSLSVALARTGGLAAALYGHEHGLKTCLL